MAPAAVVTSTEQDVDDALRRTWGENLTEQMALLGLSNKALASKLKDYGVDVSPQAIGQWRSGQTAPRPSMMVACAAALRVSPRILFSLDIVRIAA